jgi:glycosyltransferase involved in cell wall biosynthesis
MRIVYLYGGLFNPGGMERVITIKANYLAEIFDYEIFIVTTEQMGRPVFFPLSPKVHLYHLDIHIGKNFKKKQYIRQLIRRFFKIKEFKRKLSHLLYEIRPDITITTLSGFEIEFINRLKDGSIKIGELHLLGTFRRLTRETTRSFLSHVVGEIMTARFIKECKKLKRLIVLTEEEKSFWNHSRNVVVIPNPLSFVSEKFSTTGNKKAIAVGRLAHEKGFDMLIEAWKSVAEEHPDWELDIFGNNDNYKDVLLRLIAENRLENQVKLHESVKNIQTVYPNYSMLVLPSRMDAFPMVLLEAMACGIPSIAFDAYGPKDIIWTGENGFLVKTGDIKALTGQINRLIESPDRRKTMGNTARKMSENYQVEKIMTRWDELFKRLINEKNRMQA